jgi:hypothetical protein
LNFTQIFKAKDKRLRQLHDEPRNIFERRFPVYQRTTITVQWA